jgi:patatin-like phospholipase/acyl hydrolase
MKQQMIKPAVFIGDIETRKIPQKKPSEGDDESQNQIIKHENWKKQILTSIDNAKTAEERPKFVLVMDGGGLRGVIACRILKVIEEALPKKEQRICDIFDLIIGTSTGGLLAIGLGRLNYLVDTCDKLYETIKSEIFHKSMSKKISNVVNEKRFANYDSVKFRMVLKEYLDVNDETYLQDSQNECRVGVITTVYNNPEVSYPAVLRSYEISKEQEVESHFYPGYSNAKLLDAALATSAAPTYFNSVTIEIPDLNVNNDEKQEVDEKSELKESTKYELVDGGVSANNPIVIAFCEAKCLWPKSRIVLVSIGTGSAYYGHNAMVPKSILTMVKDQINETTSSLFSGKEYSNDCAAKILGTYDLLDYYRFNFGIDKEKTAMDDGNNMPYWREEADIYLQKPFVKTVLEDIVQVALENKNRPIKIND